MQILHQNFAELDKLNLISYLLVDISFRRRKHQARNFDIFNGLSLFLKKIFKEFLSKLNKKKTSFIAFFEPHTRDNLKRYRAFGWKIGAVWHENF